MIDTVLTLSAISVILWIGIGLLAMWCCDSRNAVRLTAAIVLLVTLIFALTGCKSLTPSRAKAVVDCGEEYIKKAEPMLQPVKVIHRMAMTCDVSCAFPYIDQIYINYGDAENYSLARHFEQFAQTHGYHGLSYESHLLAIVLHEFGHIWQLKNYGDYENQYQASLFAMRHIKEAKKYCAEKGIRFD